MEDFKKIFSGRIGILLLILDILSLFLLFNVLFHSCRARAEEQINLVNKSIIVDHSFKDVEILLTDYGNYKNLFYHMIDSKVISKNGNKVVGYFEFEVYGRNFWANVELEKIVLNENVILIKEKTIKTNLKTLFGSFKIEKLEDNKTKITLTGSARPHLPLPESLLKTMIGNEIKDLFKNINRYLLRAKSI